jgi:hypothetical protein
MYTKTNMLFGRTWNDKVTTGKHLRKHLSINIRTSFWQSQIILLRHIRVVELSVLIKQKQLRIDHMFSSRYPWSDVSDLEIRRFVYK